MGDTVHVYQVVKWDKLFEGSKTRTYSNKSTCMMPNKHNLGYRKLVNQRNGAAMFGAWCSMVQILSRHDAPRMGYLTHNGRKDGPPLTPDDLEMLTFIKSQIFSDMISICAALDVGWLALIDSGVPRGYCGGDTVPPHSDSDSDSKAVPASIPDELAAEAFLEAWQEWIVFRKEIKKPLAETTKSKQLKKLSAWGVEKSVRALTRSIEQGWQGIFDPDEKRGAKRTSPKIGEEYQF